MAMQIIEQRKRGFICVNAHPEGCRRNVEQQVASVLKSIPKLDGLQNVLVIGASTGYGLASRITAAWGFGAKTLGVFFERPPKEGATATAGYYNTVAFHELARRDGLPTFSLNGDAFSDALKSQAIKIIRKEMGPLDLVIYSLASPRRVHPRTGAIHDSALKPVGESFSSKSVDLKRELVIQVTLEPASDQEIADTIAVMGGEDWRMWMDALAGEKLLAPGARSLAYSYIGPQVTWPIYRDGTIGRAKKDLENTASNLDKRLRESVGGGARISVNKAVVTQASSAIPVVPLYLSILPPVMRELGCDEMPVDQMIRLFRDYLAGGDTKLLDAEGRIRLDAGELRPEVQAAVAKVWVQITSENLHELTDFNGFKRAFDNLFGFGVEGVDYTQPTETELSW
jgi:enoyl-[acyl-carrier protein] reductase / trans-2-enoyl-CoA reductase (NAD+)